MDSSDPTKAVFTLEGPNGNFPYLVSVFNAQTPITPVDYAIGTTLDQNSNGTGPWKLVDYNPSTGARFERNDTWWGGQTLLDSTEFQFFDDIGTMVTAMQGGAVDAIVQFQVIGGDALLNSPDFTVLEVESSTHRQIWMRCDTGQFADKAVRQALAFTFDREQMVETLFHGRASVGNDHVIAPFMEGYDDTVPQREKDIEKAKQLLADAGVTNLTATLHATAAFQEIPELAQLIQSGAEEAGINLEIALESLDTFYGAQWCPAEPRRPAVLRRRGARHRRLRPPAHARRVPQCCTVHERRVELVAVLLAGAGCGVQGVPGCRRRRRPPGREQEDRDDPQRGRAGGLPYFYNYLSGNSNELPGRTGLGSRADVPREGVAGLRPLAGGA